MDALPKVTINVAKHIYKSCDPNDTNSVSASSLVDFIKPYMPDNLSELHELQTQLDPNESDPAISSSFFFQVMSDWIARIKDQDLSNSFSDVSFNGLEAAAAMDVSPNQATSFSHGLSPDTSKISTVSHINNNTIALDNVTLQEQVQKLQHQLQKTTNELDLVKQQLVVAEEQNDSLSADLLKFQKLQHCGQPINEEINKSKLEYDEIKEEANAANRKVQHLEKLLANHEKQNEVLLSQISQLESENTYLRNKMQKYEKIRFERKKSVSEIKDELDIKETEISTLMEIIEEMKSKLDEKTELVTFYINENNMLKQRALALENLLKEIFPDGNVSLKSQEGADSLMIFNTPKLLRQLANPISPTICTPLTDPKTCNTSSPIKHDTSIDLFSSAGIVTVLRTPYKTLKEELLEVSDDKFVDDEVKRLQEVVKEQESIKNSLWENIKDLSNENKALQEYRKGYEKLVYNIQEKEDVIQHLRNELETSQVNLQEQKQFSSFDVTKESNCTKHDKGIETDTQQRANKSTATEVCEDKVQGLTLELESNKDKRNESTETDTWREKDEMIQRLKDDLKTLEASFQQEKQLNADLHKKYRKPVVDQSTQISKEETWNIPTAEVAESKKTNFAKQQMKMERLLEKQERIEKELANERGINTTLSLKLQGMREQNKQIKDDLEFHREKTSKQTEIIRTLLSEKRASEEKGQVLETENENLRKENSDLKDEKKSLTNEKHSLSQNLQNSLNRLAIEASLGNNARVENELLQNKLWQMEAKLKDECIKQIHMKKQIIDLKTTNNSKFIELERNLSEKENKIENLQKQIEVINIEVFLSVNNKELGRTTSHILGRFKNRFENELDPNLLLEVENTRRATNFSLEKEMVILNINVKLAVQLLEVMAEKLSETETRTGGETFYVPQSLSPNSSDEFFDSHVQFQESSGDSFMSCLSEVSDSVKECMQIVPLESDSFLNELELSDESLRELSKEDVEEKFTTLVLTFTHDSKTSKKRYLNQKEKCDRLLMKFFTYLNYSTDLIRRLNYSEQTGIQKTAVTYLQLLKSISEDVFKAAVQCGVLQYEKRTVNCWNLMINYVATLSKENRQYEQIKDLDESQDSKSLTPVVLNHTIATLTSPLRRSNFLKIIKFLICIFFLVAFVLFVMLVLYVDYVCPKDGRRICPLDWILSHFVTKIHSHQIL